MSDKNRMVVLDVDLACHRCNKKIKKVLDKYQEKWDIESYGFDDKENEVRIIGPFDPDKLIKRLCKKACDVIREWCIVAPKPPAPKVEPPKAPPAKELPKADPPKKDPPKADPPKADPPKKDPEPPKADPPKKDPPKADPPKVDPPKKDPPKADPPKKPEPPAPAQPANCYPFPYPYPYPIPFYYPGDGCDGHNKPCSCGGTCGGYRPCGCGCGGGCSGAHQQQPTYVDYGRPCQWVCEEETTGPCKIM